MHGFIFIFGIDVSTSSLRLHMYVCGGACVHVVAESDVLIAGYTVAVLHIVCTVGLAALCVVKVIRTYLGRHAHTIAAAKAKAKEMETARAVPKPAVNVTVTMDFAEQASSVGTEVRENPLFGVHHSMQVCILLRQLFPLFVVVGV